MGNFIFMFKNRKAIKSLMTQLGLSKEEAGKFLYENYTEGTTFKNYFKKYLDMWVPNGEDKLGNMNRLYTFNFPKRKVFLELSTEDKDFQWKRYVS